MPVKSARSNSVIFRQICELIPAHLVPKIAREHGVRSCRYRGRSSELFRIIPL